VEVARIPHEIPAFGTSLASDGTLAAVGAPEAGSIAVVDLVDRRIVGGDSQTAEGFGAAVDILEDTLVVGAPGETAGGAVFVYVVVGGSPALRLTVDSSRVGIGDRFGAHVALASPTVLVVGAPGASRVTWFDLSGPTALELASIEPLGVPRRGVVAAGGGFVAIGSEDRSGAWEVLVHDASGLRLGAIESPGEHGFGSALALAPDPMEPSAALLAVGSPELGRVHLFRVSRAVDGLSTETLASYERTDVVAGGLGLSVDLGSDELVVGAPLAARAFRASLGGPELEELAPSLPTSPVFGWSVCATDGPAVLVGAPGDARGDVVVFEPRFVGDDAGVDAGQVDAGPVVPGLVDAGLVDVDARPAPDPGTFGFTGGGCRCAVAGRAPAPSWGSAWLVALALAAVVARRRRDDPAPQGCS
jgi:MYXO-CTERM domain-containing protein